MEFTESDTEMIENLDGGESSQGLLLPHANLPGPHGGEPSNAGKPSKDFEIEIGPVPLVSEF